MKKNIVTIISMIAFMLTTSFTENINFENKVTIKGDLKTEKFKVYGNCGMCKKRIEGALADVKGVKSAIWNVKTKIITIKFDVEIISLQEINQLIANVGHDTESVRSSDKVYKKLHGCCQYERAN